MISSFIFLLLSFTEVIAYPMNRGTQIKSKIINKIHSADNFRRNTERSLLSIPYLAHESSLSSFQIASDRDVGTLVFSFTGLLIVAGVLSLLRSLFASDSKQGLGDFLSDGKGFNNSGYKPLSEADVEKKNSDRKSAMKLWKLPKLSFVETFDDNDDDGDSNNDNKAISDTQADKD
jgi:hypothetical protein